MCFSSSASKPVCHYGYMSIIFPHVHSCHRQSSCFEFFSLLPLMSYICSQLIQHWYFFKPLRSNYPDSKVHVAHMGPTLVLSASGRPHVGPMLAPWTLLSGYSLRSADFIRRNSDAISNENMKSMQITRIFMSLDFSHQSLKWKRLW